MLAGMKLRATRRVSQAALPDGAEKTPPTLPPWRAFVVQFSAESDTRTGVFSGRVEHLNSGRRAQFGSRQELLAALVRLLDEIEVPSK